MISKNPFPNFKKKWDIVGCFIQCNGEFVLLHRSKKDALPNTWGLPAGKKENGETIEQAIIREVKEETGLDIPNPGMLTSLGVSLITPFLTNKSFNSFSWFFSRALISGSSRSAGSRLLGRL